MFCQLVHAKEVGLNRTREDSTFLILAVDRLPQFWYVVA